MELDLHPGTVAVARLGPSDDLPAWAAADARPLHAVVRTEDELSVTTSDHLVPEGVEVERGWRALAVRGPLNFGMTGVLASLAAPLAAAEVPIFVVSTFDTDWVLIGQQHLASALDVLVAEGHVVHR